MPEDDCAGSVTADLAGAAGALLAATAARATTAACRMDGEGRAEFGAWGQRASPPPATTGVRSTQRARDFMVTTCEASRLPEGRKFLVTAQGTGEGFPHEDLFRLRRSR